MAKITLNEYIKNRLNKIISESGIGVSDEVDKASEELYRELIKNQNYFAFECFGATIKVFPRHKNFLGMAEYEKFISSSPLASWIEPQKWIIINIPYINKEIISKSELKDAIQHELEHVYQNVKMGHGFGQPELYAYALSRLSSPNPVERALAEVIYASTRSEQDAMINGLYAKIKLEKNERPLDDIIKDSEAFTWLGKLHKSYRVLKDMDITSYVKPYTDINKHYDSKKIMVIARKGIKEFEWKLARLIKGCKQRFMIENNVRPHYRSNITLPNNYLYFLN